MDVRKKFWKYEPRLVEMSELKAGDFFREQEDSCTVIMLAHADPVAEPERGEGAYGVIGSTWREEGKVRN